MSSDTSILFFAAIWILAIITAVVGFYITWDHIPALMDSLMSVTLLAPYALPQSFADVTGITKISSGRVSILVTIVYWLIVIALHWLAYKTKSVIVFLILGAIVLASGYKWFVVGTGMMGI